MVNSLRKGYRSQRKTHLWFEKRGWKVYTVPRVRFSKNQDMFHLFDHVAWNPETKEIRFIQTKSNNCTKSVKDRIAKFKPKTVSTAIFLWKDYAREPEII